MKPPKLSPSDARQLRVAVTARASQHEIETAMGKLRRDNPDWSTAQLENAAMLKIADRDGIDW